MKRFYQYTSFLLLAAISFFVSPKELLHELLHQHETVDVKCIHDCPEHVSTVHQHCDLLQQSVPPLYHFTGKASLSALSFFFVRFAEPVFACCSAIDLFQFFRGPPVFS